MLQWAGVFIACKCCARNIIQKMRFGIKTGKPPREFFRFARRCIRFVDHGVRHIFIPDDFKQTTVGGRSDGMTVPYFRPGESYRNLLRHHLGFFDQKAETILSRLRDLPEKQTCASIEFGELLRNGFHQVSRFSKHNRVAGCHAGFAELLHVIEELFFGIREDVAGMQHGIDFLQQRRRLLDGDPVAGVGAVVKNFFQ